MLNLKTLGLKMPILPEKPVSQIFQGRKGNQGSIELTKVSPTPFCGLI